MDARAGQGFRIALVGRRLAGNENLGLACLRAALEAAGCAVETHVLNEGRDLARLGAALCARPPGLVGLALPDGGSAFLPLALGELLAARGFAGAITCGGPFATLARRWLLERYAWLGSVVRFAGEVPLVALARRLAAGESIAGVPGVTTRDGDGLPAPVTDDTPLRLRPAHDELPEFLGRHAAHVAATRGCRGRCTYCGPAALQTLERDEGRRAGIAPAELSRCGVGGVRRRDLDDVCDELAELWHHRDVRYFYFVDEHLLPYDEAAALAFLRDWRAGLRRRRVGHCGMGGMLRADRLTPALADALADLGFIRLFLGLEFAAPAEARRHGRRAPGPAELALVGRLGTRGVVTVSNLMLVHPDSTPETIAAGIELLARLPAGSFEATRMMAYHGTRLHERLAREGRLLGNPLRWGYRIDDPVVDRFAQIFARLRAEVFGDYSLGYRTHDAHLALALRRRLGERPATELGERLEAVRRAVNALCVDAYREALRLARAGAGFGDCTALLDATRTGSAPLQAELERLESRILAGKPGRSLLAPMRAAAAGALSFCLAAAAPSCCRCPERTGGAAAAEQPPAAAGADASLPPAPLDPFRPQPPETDADGAAEADTAVREAASADDAVVRSSAEDARDPDADAGRGPSPVTCTDERRAQDADALRRRVADIDRCYSGYVIVEDDTPDTREVYAASPVQFVWRAHGDGHIYSYRFQAERLVDDTGFELCTDSAAVRARARRVADAMAGDSFPCAGPGGITIDGGAQADLETMSQAAARCVARGYSDFQVVLDERGAVVDVRSTQDGDETAEVRQCVRKALRGLVFPCLAGFAVCPEFVIIE